MDTQKIRFFLTAPYACNYLKDHDATNLFVDPLFPKNKQLYSLLIAKGFRRNGDHLYKPYCSQCAECISVRIPVYDFIFSRNQKRVWKKNSDLTVQTCPADFQATHFELYKKYIAIRHKNGSMDNPTEANYKYFFWADWAETKLIEFRLDSQLIAIAVIDQLEKAFSAVYTFFDPDHARRSLGKFAILWLIEKARKSGHTWLYLGYWVADCNKMKYKIEYQPIECFINEEWQKFSALSFNNFAVMQN